MKSNPHRIGAACCMTLAVLACPIAGCVVHEEPGHVIIDDDHGYHHEGYYDDHHVWHGGYYDENHQYHGDPGDWHH